MVQSPDFGEEALAAGLEAVRHKVEDKFLAAGEILSQSVRGTETLISALDKLAETLNPKAVKVTTDDLKAAARNLNSLPPSQATRIANIQRLGACREKLAEQISAMRGALSYMQAFTVNIKIVAGGLGDTGGEFTLFANDIAECIAVGAKKLKSIDEDVVALQQKLETADIQASVLGRQITKLIPILPEELIRNAEAMSAHYNAVGGTVGDVASLARDIRQNAARILVALQIGDITRQRIEHVQTAMISAIAGNQVLSRLQSRRVAAFIFALQGAQLESTAQDFEREVTQIGSSMAVMASHARELLKLHGMAFGGGEGNRGFLHELVTRIEQAQELIGKIEASDREAIATGQETADSAQKLGARINEIQLLKNDVQYMALNTTLKCCQIGDIGRPLSVIAIELRDHGSHLEEAAVEGLSVIDRLIACTNELAQQGKSENLESDSAAAAEALAVAADRIRDARDKTEADIASIAAEGDAVLNMLELSKERLRFQEDIGANLSIVAEGLVELGCDLEPVSDDIAPALEEILNALAKQYTMAQERDIHRAFVERWSIPTQEEAVAEEEDDLDSVLF